MRLFFLSVFLLSLNSEVFAAVRWKRKDSDVLGGIGSMLNGLIQGIVKESVSASTNQDNEDKRHPVDIHGKLRYCNFNPQQCDYLSCLAENFQRSPHMSTMKEGSKILFNRDMRQALENDPMISKIACDKVGLNEFGCRGFRAFLGLIDMIDPNKGGDPMRPTVSPPPENGGGAGPAAGILAGAIPIIENLIGGGGEPANGPETTTGSATTTISIAEEESSPEPVSVTTSDLDSASASTPTSISIPVPVTTPTPAVSLTAAPASAPTPIITPAPVSAPASPPTTVAASAPVTTPTSAVLSTAVPTSAQTSTMAPAPVTTPAISSAPTSTSARTPTPVMTSASNITSSTTSSPVPRLPPLPTGNTNNTTTKGHHAGVSVAVNVSAKGNIDQHLPSPSEVGVGLAENGEILRRLIRDAHSNTTNTTNTTSKNNNSNSSEAASAGSGADKFKSSDYSDYYENKVPAAGGPDPTPKEHSQGGSANNAGSSGKNTDDYTDFYENGGGGGNSVDGSGGGSGADGGHGIERPEPEVEWKPRDCQREFLGISGPM